MGKGQVQVPGSGAAKMTQAPVSQGGKPLGQTQGDPPGESTEDSKQNPGRQVLCPQSNPDRQGRTVADKIAPWSSRVFSRAPAPYDAADHTG